MRVATRNDSLASQADKDKLKAVADTVMLLVDAMVRQTEQQLNDSAAVLQVGRLSRAWGSHMRSEVASAALVCLVSWLAITVVVFCACSAHVV